MACQCFGELCPWLFVLSSLTSLSLTIALIFSMSDDMYLRPINGGTGLRFPRLAVDTVNGDVLACSALADCMFIVFDNSEVPQSQLEVEGHTVIDCFGEVVPSSIFSDLFHLDGAMPADTECVWILSSLDTAGASSFGLSICHRVNKIWVIAPSSPPVPRDGRVGLSSSGLHEASLGNVTSMVGMKSKIVLMETEPWSIRLLDRVSWMLTTITTDLNSLSPNLNRDHIRLFPGISSPNLSLSHSFVPSDNYVLLEHGGTVSHLDIMSGKILSGPKFYGDTYDYALPIPSARIAPAYILRFPHYSEIMRVVDGVAETARVPLKRGHGALYFAPMDLALIIRSNATDDSLEDVCIAEGLDWRALPRERLPPTDLSPLFDLRLISNFDLTTIRGPSNIAGDTLRKLHPTLEVQKFHEIIKPFPSDSRTAFIAQLFGKSPSQSIESEDMVVTWSHVIYMWRELGLKDDVPLVNFCNFVVPTIPRMAACAGLHDVWNDTRTNWTREDPMIKSLAKRIQNNFYYDFVLLMTTNPLPRDPSLCLSMLAYSYENFQQGGEVDHLKGLFDLEMDAPVRIPVIPARSEGPMTPRLKVMPVELVKCSVPPVMLLKNLSDFALILSPPNDRLAIVGHVSYLSTRWPWFSKLIGSDYAKKVSWYAEMPSWVTPGCLTALLGQIHANRAGEALDPSDALKLLEHAQEMQLADAHWNFHPTFVPLLRACQNLLFPEVNAKNILSQLRCYQVLGMDSIVERLLTAIASGKYEVHMIDVLDELPLELLLRLRQARMDWKRVKEDSKD